MGRTKRINSRTLSADVRTDHILAAVVLRLALWLLRLALWLNRLGTWLTNLARCLIEFANWLHQPRLQRPELGPQQILFGSQPLTVEIYLRSIKTLQQGRVPFSDTHRHDLVGARRLSGSTYHKTPTNTPSDQPSRSVQLAHPIAIPTP